MGITIILYVLVGLLALIVAGTALSNKIKKSDAAELLLFMTGLSCRGPSQFPT